MKQPVLLAILGILTVVYFCNPERPAPAKVAPTPPRAAVQPASAARPIVVAAPSSYERWKTGPTAQNDWKIGPNAQTAFEPFAPSEHANWNQKTGYTIIAGARLR